MFVVNVLFVLAAISVPTSAAKLPAPSASLVRPELPKSIIPTSDGTKVIIAVAVDGAGNATYARIKTSSGNSQFDDAMLDAALKSRYKGNGKPATVTVEYEYNHD